MAELVIIVDVTITIAATVDIIIIIERMKLEWRMERMRWLSKSFLVRSLITYTIGF